MTEEKKEEVKNIEKQIYRDYLDRLQLVDGQKVYQFIFPLNSTLEDKFSAVCFIKDALLKAIEDNAKAEKEKAEKIKVEEIKADSVGVSE